MPLQRRNQELIDLLRTPMTRGAREAGGGGHEIQDEGVTLPQQDALDFQGDGVTASDDAPNGKTVVSIPGVTEGPDIDLVGQQVGRGGDRVLLFDANGGPLAEFETITEALAAAASGDMVQPQAGTYTENITIPAGVTVRGRGPATVIAGTVTGGDGAVLQHVRVVVDGDGAGLLYGVYAGSEGTFTLEDCEVLVDNSGGDGGGGGELVAFPAIWVGTSWSGEDWILLPQDSRRHVIPPVLLETWAVCGDRWILDGYTGPPYVEYFLETLDAGETWRVVEDTSGVMGTVWLRDGDTFWFVDIWRNFNGASTTDLETWSAPRAFLQDMRTESLYWIRDHVVTAESALHQVVVPEERYPYDRQVLWQATWDYGLTQSGPTVVYTWPEDHRCRNVKITASGPHIFILVQLEDRLTNEYQDIVLVYSHDYGVTWNHTTISGLVGDTDATLVLTLTDAALYVGVFPYEQRTHPQWGLGWYRVYREKRATDWDGTGAPTFVDTRVITDEDLPPAPWSDPDEPETHLEWLWAPTIAPGGDDPCVILYANTNMWQGFWHIPPTGPIPDAVGVLDTWSGDCYPPQFLPGGAAPVGGGAGDACALYSGAAGKIVARRCLLRGVSVGGDGWAAYVDGGGGGDLVHCTYQCNDEKHPLYDASEEA